MVYIKMTAALPVNNALKMNGAPAACRGAMTTKLTSHIFFEPQPFSAA
jgi:hypothetical protein